MRTETRVSAGGVLWRAGGANDPAGRDGSLEFCLIRTGPARWQLPKGSGEPGEALPETARREIREETGCAGEVEAALGVADFWFVDRYGAEPVRVHKFVHFFLVRFTDGSTDGHDDEVEEARWLPAERAITTLAFENERVVARGALARLRGVAAAGADGRGQAAQARGETEDGGGRHGGSHEM